MNHFSYPLTAAQINFLEASNIYSRANPKPQTIEPAAIFLPIECPHGTVIAILMGFIKPVNSPASSGV